MNQWIFDPEMESPKAIMDGTEVVMYIDDVPEEIAAKVVELHNEGKTPEEINAYLEQDNGCFTDNREFIMEQITNYIKLSSGEAPVLVPPAGPQANGGSPEPDKPLSPQQRAANTRKENAAKNAAKNPAPAAASTVKKATVKDAIKDMEDKITLLKTLDSAPALEIPTGLGKAGRELLIEFQKEQEALAQKYITRIQKM